MPTGPSPESGGFPGMPTQDTSFFFLYTHTSVIFPGFLIGHSLYPPSTLLQDIFNIFPLHVCAEKSTNHSQYLDYSNIIDYDVDLKHVIRKQTKLYMAFYFV